jgi:ribosomal protein S18 acetylase RimI-like enzyme
MASLGAPDFLFREEVRRTDVEAVEQVVASTGFFTPAERAVAVELVEERLRKGEASGYLFLFAEYLSGVVAGYTCYGPVPATQGTFDLYWIAVRPEYQRAGLGGTLLLRTEAAVVALGGIDFYIETSSRALYQPTQSFYSRAGYRLAAQFPDFYAPGDGKLVYVKRLRSVD